jgi:hypothetical protein
VLRLINAVNLTNMHGLYSGLVDDTVYTMHLPISLGTSLLLSATFSEIHTSVSLLKMTKKRSRGIIIGTVILYIFEIISKLINYFVAKPLGITWWGLPTILFYAIADLLIGGYYSYIVYRLKRFLAKNFGNDNKSGNNNMVHTLQRIYRSSLPISIGSFGWLITLLGVLFFTTNHTIDPVIYIHCLRLISLLGFFFVELTSYGIIFAFSNPVEYEQQANRAYLSAGLTALVSDKTLSTDTVAAMTKDSNRGSGRGREGGKNTDTKNIHGNKDTSTTLTVSTSGSDSVKKPIVERVSSSSTSSSSEAF